MMCPYAHIFGKPKEGVHAYRIWNIAVVDVLLTVVVAYFLSKYRKGSFIKTSVVLFLLGILAHRIFCVKTTVDKFLFE